MSRVSFSRSPSFSPFVPTSLSRSLTLSLSSAHALQGAWGGRGVKKSRNPKKFIKKVAGIDVAKRHDFGKSNVIISEKKDKKAAKYQTKDLPYPYTSAAQYEASLSQAVGTEWATRTTHQKLTMPRVVVKVRPFFLFSHEM